MKRRISSNRCPFCGGPAEADCVDNHGKPYKGCSNGCRIKSPKEIREWIEGVRSTYANAAPIGVQPSMEASLIEAARGLAFALPQATAAGKDEPWRAHHVALLEALERARPRPGPVASNELPTERQIKMWLERVSTKMTGRLATAALAILDAIDWTESEKT